MKTSWSRSVAVVRIVAFVGLTMIPPGSTLAEDAEAQAVGTNSSEGTGIQVASWALTVPYCLGKVVYAVTGAVVGGMGYLLSGGDKKPHRPSVWTPSIYGTYILRPAYLRGEEPIHFLRKSDNGQSEPAPQPVKAASGTSEPAKQ